MRDTKKRATLWETLLGALSAPAFCKAMNLTPEGVKEQFQEYHLKAACRRLKAAADANGRFAAGAVLPILQDYLPVLADEPREGWLVDCYNYVLRKIFPETTDPENADTAARYEAGRRVFLQILRGLYHYEKVHLPFDPRYNFEMLPAKEIKKEHFTREYLRLRTLVRDDYIYEYMRLAAEVTPFNALGHIGGVTYVATFMARQLHKRGVPVDVALIAGAAAVHDMGKYGVKKGEERRVPYLHYYYTDIFCEREGLPQMGHIAANHSVWDLELENLSVESLLLIYADFRVKSSRNEKHQEVIHFYTLKEAFDVILNKLDDVDDAKRQRYQRVYAKLADFEDYMLELGVTVDLPENFAQAPARERIVKRKEKVLMEGEEVVRQLKFTAIAHNIELMAIFRSESDFGNLIEAARSEQNWKNLRTYITIFEEYSTYMTEQQKLMTLQFLFELLSHREEDIRVQAAELMGRIVARFNERYTKELPKGVNMPRKKVTNQTLFSQFVAQIINPGRRYTQQHKNWIGSCLGPFVRSVLATRYERIGTAAANIAEDKNPTAPYLEVLQKYYEAVSPDPEERMTLLQALLALRPEDLTEGFCQVVRAYLAKAAQQDENTIVRLAALYGMHHLFKKELDETEFIRQLLRTMNLPEGLEQFQGRESSLFLEDLKTGTHWLVKIANIHLMCHALLQQKEQQSGMHLGMHLCNLVKVSEHLAVRQAAGEALLAIADTMTYSQRNEMAVELFNGLEIGDLQIAKYVPEYLGKMALKLRPGELDEFISTLQDEIESTNFQLATSAVNTMGVMLENFQDFSAQMPQDDGQNEKRQLRLLYAMLRAYAHYDKELSRDAFRDIGTYIFHSPVMPEIRKDFFFLHSYKKIWVLLNENTENMLDFYSNAAVLNHIYRFISWSEFAHGHFVFPPEQKVCFYPGTFDPFSSGHKAVAKRIRDMGFIVYLALDEFSWSKHTQPRLMRRKIMNMSVADTENIYPFSENLSVNIANPDDIKKLKEIFADKDLYIAVGSDVVENASAYRQDPGPNTIHSVNHIIFERETREQANWYSDTTPAKAREKATEKLIKGDVIHLKLDKFYEDISSTRIRENIDQNRDISALIDTVAQNFIYANNLYLREPAYKHVLEAQEIGIGEFRPRTWEELPHLQSMISSVGANPLLLQRYLEWDGHGARRVYTQYVNTGGRGEHVIAFGAVHQVPMQNLLVEFRDARVAEHVREEASGRIAAIGYFYVNDDSSISYPGQILLAEMMTELINRDFTYVVYHPIDPTGYNERTVEALTRQGFVDIAPEGSPHPLYAVHIKSPVVLFRDVETTIKNPFNKNPRVLRALDKAHNNLLEVMRRIYPGKLILSFNTSAMHYRIIQKVARLNGVSTAEDPQKRRGPYMSVPFGKALSDVLVPNTVTKALHIEKYFNRAVKGFMLAEAHHYATVDNQVKTIKSFHRPVILIDDLLEKGHRMRMLTPYLKKNDVEVKAVLAGVMSGFAMDLMAQQGYHCECAYFLPSLEMWLNERDCYPFIGGDSIDNANNYSGYDRNPSVNLILPYVKPEFIQHGDEDAAFIYSLTCLQNAKLIMETLQAEYQALYEKRLTLKRLGEVITVPRIPDIDIGVKFDTNMDPTRFIENDIERLVRLRWGELGLNLQSESERNRGGE
jgi:nicotinic acid mononucleotide adenylyltransferase